MDLSRFTNQSLYFYRDTLQSKPEKQSAPWIWPAQAHEQRSSTTSCLVAGEGPRRRDLGVVAAAQQAVDAWGGGQGDGRRRAAWLRGQGDGARPWRCGSGGCDSGPIRPTGRSRGRGRGAAGAAGRAGDAGGQSQGARREAPSAQGARGEASRSPWCRRNPTMQRDDVHVQGLTPRRRNPSAHRHTVAGELGSEEGVRGRSRGRRAREGRSDAPVATAAADAAGRRVRTVRVEGAWPEEELWLQHLTSVDPFTTGLNSDGSDRRRRRLVRGEELARRPLRGVRKGNEKVEDFSLLFFDRKDFSVRA